MVDVAGHRWYRLTPDRLIAGLLAVEGLLWLSDRLGWPAWHKGYAVLTAVATVGAGVALLVAWCAVAWAFRWRFHFSITSLLVLTVAVAVPCSWLAVALQRTRKQREVISALEAEGFSVSSVYWNYDGVPMPLLGERLAGREWLCHLLGGEFFADVTRVIIAEKDVDETLIERLKTLPHLDTLILLSCRLSERGMRSIGDLATVRYLTVEGTGVNDAGVMQLARLTRLEKLEIAGTEITDDGLKHLACLSRLEELDIRFTRVTDEGVERFRSALPDCEIYH